MTIADIVARMVGSGIESFDAGAAGPGGSRGLASQIGSWATSTDPESVPPKGPRRGVLYRPAVWLHGDLR